jgi:hypothetical protein
MSAHPYNESPQSFDNGTQVGQIFLPKRFDKFYIESGPVIGISCVAEYATEDLPILIESMTIVTSVAGIFDLAIIAGNGGRSDMVHAFNNVTTPTFTHEFTRPLRIPPNTNMSFIWVSSAGLEAGYVRAQYVAGRYIDAPYALGGY